MISEFKGDLIQWLRGFYYLAKSENMSAALHKINRTQSALAYQIRSLEKEFGTKLFKINAGRRCLTDDGRVLLEKTEKIFRVIAKMKSDISVLPKADSGEIRIVAIYTVLQYFLAEKARPFSKLFPEVKFCIFAEASMDKMLDMVKNEVCDLAILAIETVPSEFLRIPLFRTDVSLITPRTGPFAVTGDPVLEEIARLPCIYTLDNASIQIFLDEEFAKYGLKINRAHLISHYEGAKAYVRKGYGVTFLDTFACSENDYNNYNIVSMNSCFPKRTMSAVLKRKRFQPSYLEVFLDFISSEYVKENAESLP